MNQQTRPGAWVEHVPWPEVAQRIERGATAVVPVGAGSKEHGRHLPCGTDACQARWLAEALCDELDVLVWPLVGYGYYPSFIDYPGSISISADTFRSMLEDILNGIRFAGAARIVVLNTGISTIRPLELLTRQPQFAGHVSLLNVYSGERFAAACERVVEQDFGGHADEVETSLMLAIEQNAVAMHLARPQPVPIARGLFNRTEPDQANYSPDGVNGDPSLASPAKGRVLLEALRRDCLAAVRAASEITVLR